MDKKDILVSLATVRVEVDSLKLDLNNVRFAHLKNKLTEKQMEQEILNEPDTTKLYTQILVAKGLLQKPVISADHIVIEGNRRITCLRKLKAEANAGKLEGIPKNHFDFVECEMLPSNATPEQTNLYLAMIHVKGKKEWMTFNRSKHIFSLHNDYDYSYDYLAKALGMGKSTLIRSVQVYELTDKYGRLYNDDLEWHRKYAYFDELFKNKKLKEFRENEKNVNQFSEWLHSGKFKEHKDIRLFSSIIESPGALRIFERADFDSAYKLVQKENPAIKSREFKKFKEMIDMIRIFPRKELMKTIKDPARIKVIEELKKEIDLLLKDIKSQE